MKTSQKWQWTTILSRGVPEIHQIVDNKEYYHQPLSPTSQWSSRKFGANHQYDAWKNKNCKSRPILKSHRIPKHNYWWHWFTGTATNGEKIKNKHTHLINAVGTQSDTHWSRLKEKRVAQKLYYNHGTRSEKGATSIHAIQRKVDASDSGKICGNPTIILGKGS